MLLPGSSHVPKGAVKVATKLPPKYGADKFFVAFDNGVKAMFEARHYWRFDAGDYLLSPALLSDGWSEIADFRAYPVPYPSEERGFELSYVSRPRQIGDGWLYMANIGDEWLHISYDLAAAYFTCGDGRPLSGSYYQVLSVDRSVTQDQIKQAYRAAMRRYHPDVYHGRDANQVAQRINEAYDTLSDLEARRQYDNMGQPGSDPEIKRWPGNGFGMLQAVAEKRGKTWIVRKVVSFTRRERRHVFVVPMSDVGRKRINVKAVGRHVSVDSVPEGAKAARVTFVEVVRGGWNHERREVWQQWEEKTVEVEWEV